MGETKSEIMINAVEIDDKEVARLASIEELAALGDGIAAFNASVMRARGVGCEADRALALKWLEKSANAGVPRAQGQLAYMYASGRGGLPKDKAMAKHWYSLAAEAGDAESLYRLGNIYAIGNESDVGIAKHYWSRAADLGHAKALERMRSLSPQPPAEYEAAEPQRPRHIRALARLARRILCCYSCFGIKYSGAPTEQDFPKPSISPLVEPLIPDPGQDELEASHLHNHQEDEDFSTNMPEDHLRDSQNLESHDRSAECL